MPEKVASALLLIWPSSEDESAAFHGYEKAAPI
jgi:hypothetical protein